MLKSCKIEWFGPTIPIPSSSFVDIHQYISGSFKIVCNVYNLSGTKVFVQNLIFEQSNHSLCRVNNTHIKNNYSNRFDKIQDEIIWGSVDSRLTAVSHDTVICLEPLCLECFSVSHLRHAVLRFCFMIIVYILVIGFSKIILCKIRVEMLHSSRTQSYITHSFTHWIGSQTVFWEKSQLWCPEISCPSSMYRCGYYLFRHSFWWATTPLIRWYKLKY